LPPAAYPRRVPLASRDGPDSFTSRLVDEDGVATGLDALAAARVWRVPWRAVDTNMTTDSGKRTSSRRRVVVCLACGVVLYRYW
jgi:hypothetical protein